MKSESEKGRKQEGKRKRNKRIKDEFRIVWDFCPALLPHPSTSFPGTELLVEEREKDYSFLINGQQY